MFRRVIAKPKRSSHVSSVALPGSAKVNQYWHSAASTVNWVDDAVGRVLAKGDNGENAGWRLPFSFIRLSSRSGNCYLTHAGLGSISVGSNFFGNLSRLCQVIFVQLHPFSHPAIYQIASIKWCQLRCQTTLKSAMYSLASSEPASKKPANDVVFKFLAGS